MESYSRRKDYLTTLEIYKIRPNFWCSEEYFERAELQIVQIYPGGIGVVDTFTDALLNESYTGLLFPPVDVRTGMFPASVVWADFEGFKGPPGVDRKFLDYEYIYDPKAFQNMSGKKWSTFRKNCRKFPREFKDWEYRKPNRLDLCHIPSLISDWVESCKDENIHDAEVLLSYCYDGMNKKVLIADGLVVGINVWDENYMFINFRYCICKDLPFLSEFMRWLFYTDNEITIKNKLVNDGGVLDRPGLKTFKDKMNPVEVREIYSWG